MGIPRLIILVRHGQSEGNKNRDIHQCIPDHRVKLTSQGWSEAEGAGRNLRQLLREDDTIRIFTSPYRRTRETTEGILRTLTADDDVGKPSPFQRENIVVYEEPRLREQDFGNFQPCSVEMERMWQERADYGHFFYRIPNGESAADAYDRVSGFNESLWRQFGDEEFPSVLLLVTHGLMTRVFLMKWYHWSVEYFEDLRNIHHCEAIVMEKDDQQKYVLQTTLRTWSELHSRNGGAPPSPKLQPRRWGGCSMGCNHHAMAFPRRTKRTSTVDITKPQEETDLSEHDDHPVASQTERAAPSRTKSIKRFTSSTILHEHEIAGDSPQLPPEVASHSARRGSSADDEDGDEPVTMISRHKHLHIGRDGGGSLSGMATPAEYSEESDLDLSRHNSRTVPRSDSRKPLTQVIEEPDERDPHRSRAPKTKSPLGEVDMDVVEGSELVTKRSGDEAEEGTARGDIY